MNNKRRTIGLLGTISIGIGGMIGAGIFSIIGIGCQIGGNAVYVSFIIAGIVALLSSYSYAKLGVKYPSAGGAVEYLIRGFGDNIISGGFNILLWVGYIFALSLYARAFGSYAMTFFPTISHYWLNIFATIIIIIFIIVNFIGAKAVGSSEFFIVIIKISVLIFFSIIGFFSLKSDFLSISQWPSMNNIFFSAAIFFLAYEGFGLIANAAEDMKEPEKTLPKALYMSVAIVIAIYVSVSLTITGNLPISKIIIARDYALAEAAKPFLGLIGFKIMAIAALFSTSSAINATLYGGTNVSYLMAKEGELPAFFQRKVWGRGVEGLFITAGLVILIANLFDLSKIAMLGSAFFLLIYGAVNIAHLRLYKKTKANSFIICLSIAGCFSIFAILIYFLLKNSPLTLIAFIVVLMASFLIEGYIENIQKEN